LNHEGAVPHPILSSHLAAITICWSIDAVLLKPIAPTRHSSAVTQILNRYLIEDATLVPIFEGADDACLGCRQLLRANHQEKQSGNAESRGVNQRRYLVIAKGEAEKPGRVVQMQLK